MTVPRPPGARSRPVLLVATALVVAVLGACDTGDGKALKPPTGTMPPTTIAPTETLLSVPLTLPSDDLAAPTLDDGGFPAFQVFAPWQSGAAIDVRYTCDGGDLSPAVSWASVPDGTVELAIALVDETASDGEGPFIHWVIAGIDPDLGSLREGEVPPGAVEGVNSFGTSGYSGPCPPPGDEPHVYRLTLYALNQQTELADDTPASNLLSFIEDVALGASGLTGTARR